MKQSIVLFGHGSRDPLWRLPIEAVRQRIIKLDPTMIVECAYLELTQPNLPEAVAGLIARGADFIRVVPMFLGVGRHAREDLPRLVEDLRTTYPAIEFSVASAVGEEEKLIQLLAEISLSGARR